MSLSHKTHLDLCSSSLLVSPALRLGLIRLALPLLLLDALALLLLALALLSLLSLNVALQMRR